MFIENKQNVIEKRRNRKRNRNVIYKDEFIDKVVREHKMYTDETLLKTLRYIKDINKRTVDYKKGIEEEKQELMKELNDIKNERMTLKKELEQILMNSENKLKDLNKDKMKYN